MTALFFVTLFASATLIFVVEPMFGKMVLPRLGGSPAVWNTCLVFFQAVLLGGYGYAHLLTTRLALRSQAAVHLVVLAVVARLLPVSIPPAWEPPIAGSPIPALLSTLLIGLGGPLFALSATAPILQKWFSRTDHPAAGDPYFLYAASNSGSLMALLAFPLAIEPASALVSQRSAWSAGYLLLTALTLACAVAAYRRRRPEASWPSRRAASSSGDRLDARRRARWLALSFVPSSLMLAVTAYVTTDVAAVPLLWTVPLALYLLSFVAAFATTRVVTPPLALGAMTVLTLALVLVLSLGLNRPLWLMLPLHLATLAVVALVLHTALADDRPSTAHLTEFYLWIAAGGMLGGIFNTFIAPVLFTGVVEYPLAIAAAWLLQPMPNRTRRDRPADLVFPVLAGALTGGLAFCMDRGNVPPSLAAAALGLIVFAYFASTRHSRGVALAVVLMLAAAPLVRRENRDLAFAQRTFYGVLRVWTMPEYQQRRLLHGTTLHGVQSLDPVLARQPLSYYHPDGPIGQTIHALHGVLRRANIGVVGLGAGGLAAYAETGQRWTFYELDPAVERVARDERLFTYLRDCGTTCRVVLGDARLSLARSAEPRFDLLIIDAFSSDAIPVHLLTREAMTVYLRRLADSGVLAFHISNRHLELAPVVAALAAEQQFVAYHQRFTDGSPDQVRTRSEWVLVTRAAGNLGTLPSDPRWAALTPPEGARVWTDDFSNIVGVLKLPWR